MQCIAVQHLSMRSVEELAKDDKIQELLKLIYESSELTIVSKNDIDYINQYYKQNFNKAKTYEELVKDDRFEFLLNKLHSAKYEINKQFNLKKALQPGIISECNFSESIAKVLGLNKVIDLDNAKYNEVPREFNEFVQNSSQTFSGARYLFYNNKNKNIFIFQYGNPARGDAEVVMDGQKIRLEYKEKHAKLGEYDMLYDNMGTLIPSNKIKQELGALTFLIDSFNQNTDIFSEIGHNYTAFDVDTCMIAASMYLQSKKIDLIISAVGDSLVAINFDCFKHKTPSNEYAVSLKGSEIRTSGKNSKKVWTEEHFEQTLKDLEVVNKNGFCYIKKDKCKLVKGKGKEEITRLKIGSIYFVFIENVKDNGLEYVFKKEDVRQLVPTISMHMTINATKEELKKFLVK